MRKYAYALAIAALVSVGSCGGSGTEPAGTGGTGNPSGGGNSTTNAITVRNNLFDPSSTTVNVGTSVSWTWASGSDLHNVTFSDGQKSADQSSGNYSRTFGAAGTFTYQCTLHAGMTGTITVR